MFMKGDKDMPQCGFSAHAVSILKYYGIEFATYDVLSNPELRAGLKTFSDWPTFPQLYIDQTFVGGVDIMRQMHEAEELKPLLAAYLA